MIYKAKNHVAQKNCNNFNSVKNKILLSFH